MISRFVPIADLHNGLKIGLLPPGMIEDKGTDYARRHNLGLSQKRIWRHLKKCKELIFADEVDEVIVALMGDLIHGNKEAYQVISTNLLFQAAISIESLLPFVNRASRTYAINGSDWHVGSDGTIEDYIAKELGCYRHRTFPKMEITIQGVRFMLQHQGPSLGSRAWVRGNGMRLTLRDASIKALEEGRTAADYYLWGHWHTLHHEPVKVKEPGGSRIIHGYTLPAWCTADEYALKKVKNLEFSDVGITYFDIEDGNVTCSEERLIKRFDNVERVTHESKRALQGVS